MLRPATQRIEPETQRITGEELETCIPTTGSGDELDQLAGTLNEMMDRIRASVAKEVAPGLGAA